MTLYDTIFRRKSCRSYDMTPLSAETLADIEAFFRSQPGMLPEVGVSMTLASPEQIDCIQPWRAPHYAVLYVDEHPLNYECAGFVGQKLDLYLQSLGLGCCWLGLGRLGDGAGNLPKELNGQQFAIMLAFGTPKDGPYRTLDEFKRKTLADICDTSDEHLEVVRLAPSAVNSQPWHFVHDGEVLHLYRNKFDIVRQRMYGKYNRFDMGIAMAHLHVAYPETFTVVPDAPHSGVIGHTYVISCRI